MARTEGQWKKGIGLITPSEDVPVLLRNSYLNFGGETIGSDGYGIRDNSGTLQFKNSAGSWTNFGSGSGSAGHTIEDEGTPLTARTKLNFVGAGVTVTDDAGDDATVVTITGGGSSETPTGAVNGTNVTFTVTSTPKWIVADNTTYFEGFGYSIVGLTVTMDLAPNNFIRSIS